MVSTRKSRIVRKDVIMGRYQYPAFVVELKILCFWVRIKTFFDAEDPEFARNEAQELLDKYNEQV